MPKALNSSSANICWSPPPYNCSFTYILEIVNEDNVSVLSLSSNSVIVTTLVVGESYSFRVASVDEAERMSNWSQPVSLAVQGLLLFCMYNHKISTDYFCVVMHGYAVPAPVEIVTATITMSLPMNYTNITAVWKVILLQVIV